MAKDKNTGRFIFIALIISTLAVAAVVYIFSANRKDKPERTSKMNVLSEPAPGIPTASVKPEKTEKTDTEISTSEEPPGTTENPEDERIEAPATNAGLAVSVEALMAEETALIEELLKDYQQDAVPLMIAGKVYLRRSMTEKAIEHWEKALQVNPNQIDAYESLATCAMDKGEHEKAIKHWQDLLAINPNLPGVRAQIASNMVKAGKYAGTLEILHKEIQLDPKSVLGHFLLGEVYYQQKDFDNAMKNYKKAIELSPEHINAHFGLFNVYRNLKMSDKVQETGARLKELKAGNMEVMEEAYKDNINDLLTVKRNFITTCLDAEIFYRGKQDVKKIESLLNTVCRLDPDNISGLERLAALYEASGRVQEALALTVRLRELEPENALRYRNLGVLYKKTKRPADAELAFQKHVELLPESDIGYSELVKLYLTYRNKIQIARELAYIAVDLNPSAENYFLLGWSCEANGERATALEQLKKAIELDPNNARYRQVYEQLILK